MPAPDWINSLADDTLKSDPALAKYQSVEELAKGHLEAQKLIGRKGVILPGEGAKEEDWAPVFDALGRPKTADEYKLPEFKGLPEGVKLNEAEVAEFRKYAHSIGIPQKQFEKLLDYRVQSMLKEHQEGERVTTESVKAAETKLRSEWGAKYDEKLKTVNKMLTQFGKDVAGDIAAKYGADPVIIALLGRVAENLSESTLESLGTPKTGTLTPDEAQTEIAKIRGDEKHPFNDNRHPDHDLWVNEKMPALYAMLKPGLKKF